MNVPFQVPEIPKTAIDTLIELYRKLIEQTHPDKLGHWPFLSGGLSAVEGYHHGWVVLIVRDRPGASISEVSGAGEMTQGQLGGALDSGSIEAIRKHLAFVHHLTPRDAVVLVEPKSTNIGKELGLLLLKHELALGLVKQRIFLSHKTADKPLVRDFKATLEALGFQPWLDEDDMPAGTETNRAILAGMKESCAAVFFVTKNFADKTWIGDEVDYAKMRKNEDGDRFSIITLVFEDALAPGAEKNVPELFRAKYIYKKPNSDLEALREILRALPLATGDVRLR
jgi:hypothetical protein